MSGLVTAHGNQQYRRSLARVNDQIDIELARSASVAEIDSARLDGLQLIAARALHGIALVSQLEQQLALIVPIAASRLQTVGDVHALASAQAVSDSVRRFR
jgi:hypothetical protein